MSRLDLVVGPNGAGRTTYVRFVLAPHWTRLGMHISMRSTAARRRIERAVSGQLPLSELTEAEREVANAEITWDLRGRCLAGEPGTRQSSDEWGHRALVRLLDRGDRVERLVVDVDELEGGARRLGSGSLRRRCRCH